MSTAVLVAVLAGALLHAAWNAAVKASGDTAMEVVAVGAAAGAAGLAALAFFPAPLPASAPFIAASTVIHVAYFALVAAAYRTGDLSLAYPLMRGSAPLLVATASAVAGEPPGPATWLGVLLVSGGILGLALEPRGARRQPLARSVGFALCNAVVIAAYTLVDGAGVRRSGSAFAYTGWVFLLTAVPLAAWALAVRRPRLVAHLRRRWPTALLGGLCSAISYTLALWAMTRAAIAPVAALRETSIVFGVLIAAVLLHERVGARRAVAAATVAAGVVALRLAR